MLKIEHLEKVLAASNEHWSAAIKAGTVGEQVRQLRLQVDTLRSFMLDLESILHLATAREADASNTHLNTVPRNEKAI